MPSSPLGLHFPSCCGANRHIWAKIRAFQSPRSEHSVSDYPECSVCAVQVSEDRSIGRRKTEKQPWLVHQGSLAFALHHPALPSVHLKFILFYFYLENTLLVSIIKPIYLRQCALPQPHSNGKITFNVSRPIWLLISVWRQPKTVHWDTFSKVDSTAKVSKNSNYMSISIYLPIYEATNRSMLCINRRSPWRRSWQPTPVFLPGKLHGQRCLAGYRP